MGLREAVLEIAEQMETNGDRDCGFWAKQLRLVVKASESTELPGRGLVFTDLSLSPADRRAETEKQEYLREKRLEAERQEVNASLMVELLDGNDGCVEFHPIPAAMPVGAKTAVGRKVYVLSQLDNGTKQLHYSPEETAKRFPQGGK